VPIDVGLCERCNPLGLKDVAASQAHATVMIAVIVAVVGLALLARLTIAGVGPFTGQVAKVTADGLGLAVTLTVRNEGSATGQTTCRVTDPLDRNGSIGALILSPPIDASQTRTFSQTVTEFGSVPRELTVACTSP
jgi:hypothetical protein